MEGFILILALAIITEALIEYGKSIGKAFAGGSWKTAVTHLVAIVLSVCLCLATGGDLFALVGIQFSWPWLGVVLTGIMASRGANFVSDFVKRLQGVKEE